MDMYRFAQTYGNPRTGVRFRRAKITTVPANNKVSLSMDDDTGATTHTNVNYFGALPPRNGQSVWAVVVGGEVFCLGSAAGEGGELPFVELTRASDQTAAASGYTNMEWTSLVGDDLWGMYTAGASDIPVPIRGIYAVSATVSITADAGGTYRGIRILNNASVRATTQIVHPTGTVGSGQATFLNVSWIGPVAAGNPIRIQYGHNSGVSLANLQNGNAPRLSIAYLGGFAV